MTFRVYEVPSAAAIGPEQMGTKPKFWYDDAELGPALFKEARPGHGEDWAEKAAQELAALLGVPHARYELAVCHDPRRGTRLGVVSPSFVESGATMVHGNELLAGVDVAYAVTAGGTRATRSARYTVDLVLRTVEASGATLPPSWQLPDGVHAATDVLVGYLLADAWIGNTDRHEENWAVIDAPPRADTPPTRHLAPYYDSASCLGRNESDAKRERRLATRDQHDTVEAYAARARSAFRAAEPDGGATAVSPLDAFARAAALRPAAARAWLARLDAVSDDAVRDVFAHFPAERASAPARTFARRILDFNRARLLALRPAIVAGLVARPPSQDTP